MTDHEPESDSPPLVYVNWFRSMSSPYDLTLDLGYRSAAAPPRPSTRLVLSWEYALSLRETLDALVKEYEEDSGEEIRKLGGVQLGPAQFPADR